MAGKATNWEKVYATKWFICRIYKYLNMGYKMQIGIWQKRQQEWSINMKRCSSSSLISEIQIKIIWEINWYKSLIIPSVGRGVAQWNLHAADGWPAWLYWYSTATLETILYQIKQYACSQAFHSWVYTLEQWFSIQTILKSSKDRLQNTDAHLLF